VQTVKQLEIEVLVWRRAEKKLKEREERLSFQCRHIPIPTYTWQKFGDDLLLAHFNDAAEKSHMVKLLVMWE